MDIKEIQLYIYGQHLYLIDWQRGTFKTFKREGGGGESGREGEREGEIYIKTALMFKVTTERIPADSQRPVVIAAFTSILIFIHEVPVLTESYLPLSNSSLTSSPISVNEAQSDTLVKPFFLIHFMA